MSLYCSQYKRTLVPTRFGLHFEGVLSATFRVRVKELVETDSVAADHDIPNPRWIRYV